MIDIIKRFGSFDKEPVMWITIAYIAALTGYKVVGPEHMALGHVFSQDYADYVGALVAGLFARLKVFSPDTVLKQKTNP